MRRGWRMLRTGFGFAVFGIAAPLLGGAVLIASRLRGGSASEREIFVQRAVHFASRAYLRGLAWIGVMRFSIDQPERLRAPGPHLVVANHPTLLDALVLFAALPQVDCIVSDVRAANPFLRSWVRACGYLTNDRGRQIVTTCAERLRAGRSLIVFPEGTRSPVGGLHRFQRGAAHIALVAGCDPVPVAIRCEPPTLARGQKWYDVPPRAFTLTLTVGEPIAIEALAANRIRATPGPDLAAGVASPLAARRLTAQLRETIEKQLDTDPGLQVEPESRKRNRIWRRRKRSSSNSRS